MQRYFSILLGGVIQPSDAVLCERAVLAIWRSLDGHDLVDEHIRGDLAAVLEPLTALSLDRLHKGCSLP